MSRALRRAQRQRVEALGAEPDPESSSEDDSGTTSTAPNPFDLLNGSGDTSDPEAEDSAAEIGEELDKDEQEDIDAAIIASLPEAPRPASKKRPRKKKKKQQGKKEVVNEEGRLDEQDEHDFDNVLKAHQAAISDMTSASPTKDEFQLPELLSVDVKMLDPNVEMRRLFGSKVVSSGRAERTTANRRQLPRGMQQQLARGRKSILVPVEDNYPLNIKGGLEMTMIEDVDGIRTFKFVHSRAYQQTQFTFMQCVQSGDPQTLMNLLSRAPFHVDTLLQVSEILRHQGDNEQSLEMLTRALFAFDRAFHPLFNLASGLVRLPFEYPENRPFYLAIYRYIQSLGRRGCWSTAFEFNKLLYALAPEEDPYAALLSIDFYAMRAQRWDYIEKLNACPYWDQVLDDHYPRPNFDHAGALSKLSSSKSNEADLHEAQTRLTTAVRKFPYYTGALFTELKANGPIQFDNLEPSSQFARLLRDLYVFRAKDIYNTPETIKFLRDTTLPIESFDPYDFDAHLEAPDALPVNICRHILLLDERTLLHYLPKEITANAGLAFDPLPPADSVPSYLDAFMPSSTAGSGAGAGGAGTTMIPQFIQDLLRRVLPDGGAGAADRDGGDGHALDDAQIARLMQEMQFQDVDGLLDDTADVDGDHDDDDDDDDDDDEGRRDFADPNGYGANRGVDEPEREGNAGRR